MAAGLSRNDKDRFTLNKTPLCILLAVLCLSPCLRSDDFNGTIRIFVNEPESRWIDGLGTSYDFGFLDFALTEEVEIKQYDLWQGEVIWDAVSAGFGGTSPDNLQMQAVVFRGDSVPTDGFPPNGYWFDAYYSDAACAASPGQPGSTLPAGGFTHTVFLELAGSSG